MIVPCVYFLRIKFTIIRFPFYIQTQYGHIQIVSNVCHCHCILIILQPKESNIYIFYIYIYFY